MITGRRWAVPALALALVALLAACSGAGESSDSGASTDQAAVGAGADVEAAPADGGAAEQDAAAPDLAAQELPAQVGAPADLAGDRVIKDGTIAIDVEAGGFDMAYAAIVAAARRLGGAVVGSETFTEDDADGGTTGSLTVKVPVDGYEDLLVDAAEVGEVRRRAITAEDVSTEFIDLQARQRNLEAQERFYLGLLDQAQGVQDAIAVQQQLETITGQLEEIKGRIAFLDERTSFSTLTVELREPSAAGVVSTSSTDRPSLGAAWRTAQDAFVNVVGALVVAAGFLLPLLVIGLVLVLLARVVMPRLPRRSSGQAQPTASGPGWKPPTPQARPAPHDSADEVREPHGQEPVTAEGEREGRGAGPG